MIYIISNYHRHDFLDVSDSGWFITTILISTFSIVWGVFDFQDVTLTPLKSCDVIVPHYELHFTLKLNVMVRIEAGAILKSSLLRQQWCHTLWLIKKEQKKK